MPIIPPDEKDVESTFPDFREVKYITAGGFKAVYRIGVASGIEALKIIEIPILSDCSDEENDKAQTELHARVKREVSVLGEIDILFWH